MVGFEYFESYVEISVPLAREFTEIKIKLLSISIEAHSF
jgi:hypothetical protein